MPESVKWRGSSGPTIGAIEGLLSRWVAMAPEDIRRGVQLASGGARSARRTVMPSESRSSPIASAAG